MPTISVVIPTYNRSDSLARCLNSVFSQTVTDLEVIVVDDCSTDDTEEVVNSFDNIQYIRHDRNKGGSAARNTGIKAATGKYVAFLDSDDEWLPQKVEKQLKEFTRSPDSVGVVYTGLYFSRNGERRIGRIPEASGDIYEQQLMRDHVGPTSTVMVRRECFENVGMFDPKLPARQDYDMWLRLSEEYEFRNVREPLTVLYTNRTDRISSQYEQRIQADEVMLERVFNRVADFNSEKQKKILSKQYETTALFSYLSQQFTDARRYSMKSIKIHPFGTTRWGLFVLSGLSLNPHGRIVSAMRNGVRALKYRLEGEKREV